MPDNKTMTFDVVATLVDAFDAAAQNWGWAADRGIGADPANSKKKYETARNALLAALETYVSPAAQSAGQEPIRQVKWHEGDGWVDVDRETFAEYADRALHKRFVYAAPVNGGERELGQVIDERDQYHDAAEKLADAIAKHFGVEIGEHSNLNCPWQNALDHIAQATKRAADAQQVDKDSELMCKRLRNMELTTCGEAADLIERLAALTSPAKVGGDEREAYIASLPADWHKDSSLETWFPLTADELAATKRMFGEACADLGRVNEALGLDPDDAGAEPILDAIEELKARAALPADGGEDKRDAERYRWLRDNPDEDVFVWDTRGAQYLECGRPLSGTGLDEATDAALAKARGEQA